MQNLAIKIVNYNPQWENQFLELKSLYLKALGDKILKVEHVGSTSISGLKSKPVIDIDIVIKNYDILEKEVIKELEKLKYEHLGNMGISGREAFKLLESEIYKYPKHNLYVCREGSIGIKNHILFRDYLRENSTKVKEYGDIKECLAREFPNDIDDYCKGKTEFISEILLASGMKQDDVELIRDENQN